MQELQIWFLGAAALIENALLIWAITQAEAAERRAKRYRERMRRARERRAGRMYLGEFGRELAVCEAKIYKQDDGSEIIAYEAVERRSA